MSETIPDIHLTSDQFTSINSLTGVVSGTDLVIQCKGPYPVYLIESDTKPADDSTDGFIAYVSLDAGSNQTRIAPGSLEIWARVKYEYGTLSPVSSKLSVQTL